MIREGIKNDAEQIAKLKIRNYQKTYNNIFSNQFLNEMNIEDEKQKYINGLKNRKVLVYYDEDNVLGYIYYGKRKNHKEVLKDYDGEIYAIYVDVDFQKKGIGKKLIIAALNDLINDYNKIILWCMKDNYDSLQFYEKRNFTKLENIATEIGGKELYETGLGFDFSKSKNYKLTRYVSFKEKNQVIAVYSNFDLIFLKNETAIWFKKLVNNEITKDIPISFYKYLIKKEVAEIA